MKIYYILYIIVFVVIISGCSKKDSKPYSTPINDNLKKDFNFKRGSYWVYKDSISGRIDSFAVVKSDSGSATMEINTKPSLQDYINIFIDEYSVVVGISTIHWEWNLIGSAAYINIFPGPFFYYPVVTGQTFPFIYDRCTVTNIFPNYSIGGSALSNVAEINHYDTTSPKKYNDWLYVNSDVGIVKMRLNPQDSVPFVWELQRYNIVR